MNKKYILTGETISFEGATLHRIQAIEDFGNVHAGDLGGWIKNDKINLNCIGTCWIYDDAKVKDAAFVFKGAVVRDSAIVQNYATIRECAIISENATVSDRTRVGNNAQIGGCSLISGDAEIFSNAIVKGDAKIGGYTRIGKNAYITSNDDFFYISNIGSRKASVTFYIDKDRNIYVATGCFNDTLGAFEEAVKRTHRNNKYAQEYYAAIQLAKIKLE